MNKMKTPPNFEILKDRFVFVSPDVNDLPTHRVKRKLKENIKK